MRIQRGPTLTLTLALTLTLTLILTLTLTAHLSPFTLTTDPNRKKALRPSLLELFEHAATPSDTLLHALARMPAVRPTDPWWNGTVRSATVALLALTLSLP